MEDDDVLQELSPHRSDPSLDYSVLPRTARRRSHGRYAKRLQEFEHRVVEEPVAVEDEEPRRGFVGEGFSELLTDPLGVG